MKKQIPFISRKEILSQVHDIIMEHDRRQAVCIQATGGIGKTRLLQEIFDSHQPVKPDVLPGNFKRRDIHVIILEEFTKSEWDQQFIGGVTSMAKELGVSFDRLDANFDIEKMRMDLDEAIRRQPDAIYISLGTDKRLKRGLEKASEKGIKVLMHDNFLPLKGINSIRMMQDYVDSCKILATQIVTDIDYKGKIVAVWQDKQTIQQQRRQALGVVLQHYPDVEVVDQLSVFSSELVQDTHQKTREMLRNNPDIKAFWVAFDELAKGVVQALQDMHRTDIGVYSFDLNPSTMDMMILPGSPWKATVAINPYELGRLAIRMTTLAVYGDPSIEPQISLPLELFTQKRLSENALQGKGFYENWQPLPYGYSPLIESLQKRRIEEKRGLQVVDIIDFDDHHFRITHNLGAYIADALDAVTFNEYFLALLNLHKLEEQQTGPEQLEVARKKVNQAFVGCFNQVSQNRRIVLMFDTTEKLEGSEVWGQLLFLSKNLNNTVFIFAGRSTQKIYKRLLPRLGHDSIDLIKLEPLDQTSSLLYLEEKVKIMGYRLMTDELAEKVCFLAQGRPILIDLAVEWLAKGVTLQWMNKPLGELDQRPGTRRKHLAEFEKALVGHISETRQPLDWLWLLMAHIYPLDAKMVAEILRKPVREAEEMIKLARTYVFVKPLPGNQVALHDEMQRMVSEYVWPVVDKSGDRRRHYSDRTRIYMEKLADTLQSRVDDLYEQEHLISVSGRRELDLFAEREILQGELWVAREQQLYHTFLVSLTEGLALFKNLFGAVEKANQYSYMELLVKICNRFAPQMSTSDQYEAFIREAIYLLGANRVPEARKILVALKTDYGSDTARLVDVLSRLSNCDRQTGEPLKAIEHLKHAIQVCEDDTKNQLMQRSGGAIYNALGLAYRQLGEWDEAEKYYRSAIELVKEGGSQQRLASAYTNLGYITGLKSEYESALRYCRNALQIQDGLKIPLDTGRTYNVIGIIYRGKEDYGHSIEYIEKAIAVFSELKVQRWLGLAYCERGTTEWHNEKLSRAEIDLKYGLELYRSSGSQLDLPTIYHRLGHVAWEMRKYKDAERYFRDSAKIGQKLSDYQQIVNSLEGLVELYYYMGMEKHQAGEARARDVLYLKAEKQARAWAKKFDQPRVKFPLYTGSRLRILGNIAYDQGKYSKALKRYMEAYPYIAQRGGYSRYMLPKALDWLQERIDMLPPKQALLWCEKFEKHWIQIGLNKDFPELLTTLDIARDNANTRQKLKGSKAG
ncbi:MAG TPA: substrate-binding domain-containing protein [Anaerolineales bacterium]|nr:substrate-binding domain-containing protein [Anaerolineales bacterium]